jgi:hypothetical protein
MNDEVIIVSGLPRSGTSLMMQLLNAGGIEVVTDHVRTPDTDNPRGYWELERVKKIKEDASWLPAIRGKAVKMVSQLLYDLPVTEHYRILFMERDLEEVIISQEKMLARLGRPAAPHTEIAGAFTLHLTRLRRWLTEQSNMAVLEVNIADLVSDPAPNILRVNEFVGGRLNVETAVRAIDPSLYRNRKVDANS